MGGGKSDFFTMEPPLEPPAVQEGPSDPPKLTFGAKMESRGPPGTQKACQNDPQGTPETQKYAKKTAKNYEKGSHKYIQIVFVQQREKHHQQTKKRNSWNIPNNQDKQNTKKANNDNLTKTNQDNAHNPNGPNKSKKQYKQTRLPTHRITNSNNQNKPTQSKK